MSSSSSFLSWLKKDEVKVGMFIFVMVIVGTLVFRLLNRGREGFLGIGGDSGSSDDKKEGEGGDDSNKSSPTFTGSGKSGGTCPSQDATSLKGATTHSEAYLNNVIKYLNGLNASLYDTTSKNKDTNNVNFNANYNAISKNFGSILEMLQLQIPLSIDLSANDVSAVVLKQVKLLNMVTEARASFGFLSYSGDGKPVIGSSSGSGST